MSKGFKGTIGWDSKDIKANSVGLSSASGSPVSGFKMPKSASAKDSGWGTRANSPKPTKRPPGGPNADTLMEAGSARPLKGGKI
jgi:hypothetical protein